jgi:3D-(3,5/4)-trihydroxycyclohexane-1,2-dione acylhydrolase (decyclizing)
VIETENRADLEKAIAAAKAATGPVVIHVRTDPMIGAPDSESWWDVPVSETSTLESTRSARAVYEQEKSAQRQYLAPVTYPGDGMEE